MGILYLCVDLADAFNIYKKDQHSYYGLIFLVVLALLYVLSTRRPLSRVSYKIPQKDFAVEVLIGDLFKIPGEYQLRVENVPSRTSASGRLLPVVRGYYRLWIQPVDATDWLNLSTSVS